MSTDIQVPPEVVHLLNERNLIWHEFDAASGGADQLLNYEHRIGGLAGVSNDINEQFTSSTNPVDELQAVINELQQQMRQIEAADSEIRTTQSQIRNITQHAQTMTVLLVIGIIALIGIVGFAIVNAIR